MVHVNCHNPTPYRSFKSYRAPALAREVIFCYHVGTFVHSLVQHAVLGPHLNPTCNQPYTNCGSSSASDRWFHRSVAGFGVGHLHFLRVRRRQSPSCSGRSSRPSQCTAKILPCLRASDRRSHDSLGLMVSISIVAPSFQVADLIKILGIGGVAIGFAFQNILEFPGRPSPVMGATVPRRRRDHDRCLRGSSGGNSNSEPPWSRPTTDVKSSFRIQTCLLTR